VTTGPVEGAGAGTGVEGAGVGCTTCGFGAGVGFGVTTCGFGVGGAVVGQTVLVVA
jgi:hypothetical protein